jgi:cellobiose phosphorylase
LSRTFRKDEQWTPAYGEKLRDKKGRFYKGTLIEHLLIQHLVQFFNVGEHNVTRLESADWNDGLDMAFERGESVAFMSQYGGNLFLLAQLLETLKRKKKLSHLKIAKELKLLLTNKFNGAVPRIKRSYLFNRYFSAVEPTISGEQISINVGAVINDLRQKGQWIFDHIRSHERVKVGTHRWFNGYYDNKGKRVEGKKGNRIRMTLTAQVFAIMSGLATPKEINEMIKAVNAHLKDKQLGGIRLNTDFGLRHYLDFGRAFGFAYGTKENGAFFNHMTVMYAYALYKRGFAKEGFDVLCSIYRMAANTKQSKIYPGVPEYFDPQGRGMYHYLTGSASWLILTLLTQVFGVRGHCGNLVLAPKLTLQEFDKDHRASVQCFFAQKRLCVEYHNPKRLDVGQYKINEVRLNGRNIPFLKEEEGICVERKQIIRAGVSANIVVSLG